MCGGALFRAMFFGSRRSQCAKVNGCVELGSRLRDRLAFFKCGRTVLGKEIEVYAIGHADWLQGIVWTLGTLGVFSHDAGQKESLRVFKIADQFEASVTRPDDTHVESDMTIFSASRLKIGDLDPRGQHSLEVRHRERPRKRLFIEDMVERLNLRKDLGIVWLLHHLLVALAFLDNARDLAIERVITSACRLGLAVKRMQEQSEAQRNYRKNSHRDAKLLDDWSEVGVGTCREIESYAH